MNRANQPPPPYAIDFVVEGAGHRMSSTKRRIRWRFGYANQEALEKGQTGVACRGIEHDVTVVWSVTSGKRQILMDGIEIHYALGRTECLQYCWGTPGKRIIKVVAHAIPPKHKSLQRQYELTIDGQSFVDLPSIHRIGTPVVEANMPDDQSLQQQQQLLLLLPQGYSTQARSRATQRNGFPQEVLLRPNVTTSTMESRHHGKSNRHSGDYRYN
eukprot:CAMPEP_0116559718 /NCGR_PEP_ID=MMETSP0397-20121206/10563_1 /TAXON_ID=216820 /ORGANISM="Cyclophora tenuis, Strain ECT3854" /LENGTH=213 /DNA_ID=CAMNT_0004085541 /DNA_START=125 /DNA_END=766 /DNA_ORIENTATION=-